MAVNSKNVPFHRSYPMGTKKVDEKGGTNLIRLISEKADTFNGPELNFLFQQAARSRWLFSSRGYLFAAHEFCLVIGEFSAGIDFDKIFSQRFSNFIRPG